MKKVRLSQVSLLVWDEALMNQVKFREDVI